MENFTANTTANLRGSNDSSQEMTALQIVITSMISLAFGGCICILCCSGRKRN